ncbi:hypothetical protein [Alteromonas halophila]|uniref:Uncharacterized protein n=1 Tax=Alteromonas halophila TaxID=516698 RepID=A0A918JI97_9ALTE|nr:hypothetical protein [Alteromonas halophila]GGW82384.1 hypothetical protein GCM10007391_14280 [Alteromonas halophila]
MNSPTLVITTVNPFGDIEHQAECFNSWKSAGYNVVSYNSQSEAERLLEYGFTEGDVKIIDDSETTFKQNNKYLPKIHPIIQSLMGTDNNVIITNSDIYALHCIPMGGILSSLAPSLAMTRRELLSLNMLDMRDNIFYRGGLDLFYFSSGELKKLNSALKQCEAKDDMAFGVPGWDYLVGAILLSKLQGKIVDGAVIGHQYHKNTYSGLSDFTPYGRDIKRLLNLASADPYWVAEAFSKIIAESSTVNAKERCSLQRFFHYNGVNREQRKKYAYEKELQDIDGIINNVESVKLYSIFEKVESEKDWGVANQFINACFIKTSLFKAKIFALWNYIECVHGGEIKPTTEYPEGNLHAVMIENCLSVPEIKRAIAVFDVFSSELINHNIFNRRLFDYLVLSSNDKTNLKILKKLKSCINGV